jgi:DNA-binding beta-propeller fold protein YncE
MVRRPATRLAAALAVLAVGCSACSAHSAGPGGHVPPLTPAGPVTAARGLPGCSTATAQARALGPAGISLQPVPAEPFGVVVTADGRWSFVSAGHSVAVLRTGRLPGPALVRTIPLPSATALGEALTRAGRYLLVAGLRGAEVIDVARAEQGRPHAVLGTLVIPGGMGGIEVALSPDDQYAFVSMEYTGEIAVFSLRRALAGGFGPADLVGAIRTGHAPVGLAVSPDGRWLYATSEVEAGTSPSPVPGGHSLGGQGTLQVISLRRAETDPGRSVVVTVTAGCEPVRVITSADGSVLWVTARGSDALVAFSAARLRADPARSVISWVRTGQAPVGLALVRGGSRIVVADSNRFAVRGASSSLAVLDVRAALAGRPAVLGYLRAGGFPRQMALEPAGRTLLVTNFDSGQLESVHVADLP